jgi:hypothetical protein
MVYNTDPLNPVTETSLSEFFRQRLLYSSERLRVRPQQDTFWYLGNLLERFGRSDRLFSYTQGQLELRPLALLYGDAISTEDNRQRCLLLRHLGDLALFLGALFPEFYTRHGIQQGYFVGMGGSAYDYLSDNAPTGRHIFRELSRNFVQMLQLVAYTCSQRETFNAGEVLALYQRWLLSGDPTVADQLRSLGINLSDSDLEH